MQVSNLFIIWLQLVICIVGAIKPGRNRDQCPDTFEQPFDYESIAEYSVIGHPSARIAPCVAITQLSVGRLHQLENLISVWKGVISAAIYVPTDKREANLALIQEFSSRLTNRSDTKSYTILSVLFGHEDTPSRYNCSGKGMIGFPLYPVNNLRNLAVAASAGPTGHTYPLFFLTDADFYPSLGLRSWIDAHAESGLIKRCDGGDMIVESQKPITSSSQTFLLTGIRDGTIKQFHIDRYIEGHRPTDYAKWLRLTVEHVKTGKALAPYPIKRQQGYEPYVIISRKTFVPYDERFRGYALNKIVQLEWMAERGASYHVLPGYFVVEKTHPNGDNFKAIVQTKHHYKLIDRYDACRIEMKTGGLPHYSDVTRELFARFGFSFV